MIVLNKNIRYYLKFRYLIEKLLIIICSPLIIIFSLITYLIFSIYIKNEIIFKQIRIGLNKKPFILYKFRTMNSENQIIPELNFFRLHRIDEIPQFINVLKGEMSLIGPRPETIEDHERVTPVYPEYDYRYSIKPGITGLAQVEYKHTSLISEFAAKLYYDLEYINNANIFQDIKIIFRTIPVIIFSKGAK